MSHKKQTIVTALLFGVLSVLGTLTTDADAAGSATYTLDGGGMEFMQADGASETYEMQSNTLWHAENMESETFQLTSETDAVADGETTGGGSGGGSTGGSSGGTDAGRATGGGGRRTTSPSTTDEPGTLPIGRTRTPIGRPAAPAEATNIPAPESGHVATMDTVDETSPTSAATDVNGVRGDTGNRPGVVTAGMNDDASEGGIVEAVRSSNVTKAAITTAQAATVVRLGYIYRFESLFEALPAYRMSPAAIRTMSLAVRPGSIAVDSLLWPFAWLGKFRRRKRRTNEEVQD